MLVDPDLSPQQTIYYTAGVVLDALRRLPSDVCDLATLSCVVIRVHPTVSLDTVVLSLDYLFLLGLVGLDRDGEITCT